MLNYATLPKYVGTEGSWFVRLRVRNLGSKWRWVLGLWPGCFTSEERSIGADWVEGCLGPTPTLENVIRRKICAHAGTGGWKAEVKSGSLTEVFYMRSLQSDCNFNRDVQLVPFSYSCWNWSSSWGIAWLRRPGNGVRCVWWVVLFSDRYEHSAKLIAMHWDPDIYEGWEKRQDKKLHNNINFEVDVIYLILKPSWLLLENLVLEEVVSKVIWYQALISPIRIILSVLYLIYHPI
jgi:hypothetical protein